MDLVKIIKKDREKKQGRYSARSYYKYKPQVTENEINTYSNGEIKTIKTGGQKLYTNYFKLLVNQKKNYLLAKEPETKTNEVVTVVTITDMLEEGLLNASLDTRTWLHFYVNELNKLDWVYISDKEIIPIYDKFKKNIIAVMRYFKGEDDKDTIRIETWTLQGLKVEYLRKDKITREEIKDHYEEEIYYKGSLERKEGKNFPFIPFIPLFNNKGKLSDLDGIKELIDFYNSINTGFVENIDLFQEALMKLKGFSAESDELENISANMRKYKLLGIPNEDGDAEYMKVEIPVEARKTITDILKENIFKIGQGVDPDRLAGESNVTNVVIKSRYSGLDMKANETEKQLKLFYEKFIDCVNLFYGSSISKDITFNRSMIFNESEAIDNCIKSMNLLDQETILENHPWSKGKVKEILKRIKLEKEENLKKQQEMFEMSKKQDQNLETDDINNNKK